MSIEALRAARDALVWREQFDPRDGESDHDRFERVAEAFHRATGYVRPGKDCRMYSPEERMAVWNEWIEEGYAMVRAAIAQADAALAAPSAEPPASAKAVLASRFATPSVEAEPVPGQAAAGEMPPLPEERGYRDVDGDWCSRGYSADQMRAYARSCMAAAPKGPVPDALTDAARDVLAERQRQISVEGWAPEHDDEHVNCSLAVAAACYALNSTPFYRGGQMTRERGLWGQTGWSDEWWKPSSQRRDLVKAGALILAEIERRDRADPKQEQPK